jgi:hypothetical protein
VGENRGNAEAARALDDVDEVAAGLRDHRELVDDEQHAPPARLALDGVLGEVLDQKPRRRVASCLSRSPSNSR